MTKNKHTTKKFNKQVGKLIKAIESDVWMPHYVAGIAGIGSMVAQQIAERFDIDCITLNWTKQYPEMRVHDAVIAEDAMYGTRILIVDYAMNSGETLSSLQSDMLKSVSGEHSVSVHGNVRYGVVKLNKKSTHTSMIRYTAKGVQ